MKKILLILSVLGLVACDTYTVKNTTGQDIKVNGAVVSSCSEFVDFFNLIGDFPLSFTDKDDTPIDDKEYEPGNYEVYNASGKVSIKEVDEACEVSADKEEKKPETKSEPKPVTEQQEVKPVTTPATTPPAETPPPNPADEAKAAGQGQ